MAKQKRTRIHSRHRMVLNSVAGVLNEQARIYRACVNGHLKPSDMCRMMFGLREIRVSAEALPSEAASPPPTTIHVVSVDSGQYLSEDAIRDMRGLGPFKLVENVASFSIEHNPNPPAPVEEPINEDPETTALEKKLSEMSHEQLMQLARAYNVGG